ncbi:MAG: tRNA dihydrouridine synthase DusB [Gammaproteobacteria bacterium]|nr:tRNA dihydrouridine synthase DusB [Gammaproteobacteria bacterium]
MKIGSWEIAAPVALAPMAGITDPPFRALCRRFGAALAVAEMVTADQRLWDTPKSRRRLDWSTEPEPRVVQIVGGDPRQMAEAARGCVALGAQVIDINFGCPVRKVCRQAAGAALLRDLPRVEAIIGAVVAAAGVPVTVKMRTGWDAASRNAATVARIAQQCGVAALTVHGRTRADGWRGPVDTATIAAVRSAVDIPVIANGDVTSGAAARQLLAVTGADAVMIGRAARGCPWLFAEVRAALANTSYVAPAIAAVRAIMRAHLAALYSFYGEATGVRVARKHLGWYWRQFPAAGPLPAELLTTGSADEQLALVGALRPGGAAAPARAA